MQDMNVIIDVYPPTYIVGTSINNYTLRIWIVIYF